MTAGKGWGRPLALLALCAILSSCGGTEAPPSTVVDACRMQEEKPGWFAAMRKTEDKWGVPVAVQLATIARESSFRADARPTKRVGSWIFARDVPLSSAYGYAQAIDGTWEGYISETGRRGADREDFSDASDFIGWYMNSNARVNGVPMTDAYNQYLAYHEGKAGFARGTYRTKTWLPGVARDVQNWAGIYHRQLMSCSSY